MTQPQWLTEGWPHVWLPYAQMQTAPLPHPVVDALGCELVLTDGRRLIDGISSWWSACHGHKHPHIVTTMQQQLDRLPHVMFGGLANEQAYSLAKRLADITPGDLNRVLLLDSGSVAVEVALKMALQYWRNQGMEHKNRFLCFRYGYHGDTIGAMGVSDPQQNYHQAFKHALIPQYLVDIPTDEYSLAEFESLLEDHQRHIAGCIIEPLVQGAGGMKFHSPDMLAAIRNLCAKYDVLFIADEIAVGLGRTGYLFACEEAGITPDILCLGKALTGGNITLAATIATEKVFEGFLGDSIDTALMHGTTYMGTPLACSAANASLDLFEKEPRLDQVARIEVQLLHQLERCMELPFVEDVRAKGALGVVQLDAERIDTPWFRSKFIELGVWLRPIEDIVYIAPPFVITEEQLTKLTEAAYTAIREWSFRQK